VVRNWPCEMSLWCCVPKDQTLTYCNAIQMTSPDEGTRVTKSGEIVGGTLSIYRSVKHGNFRHSKQSRLPAILRFLHSDGMFCDPPWDDLRILMFVDSLNRGGVAT
jgi:hypothetical protein